MKKNILTAIFAVCTLFLVSSCSESDDDNSALMMQVASQGQGNSSVKTDTEIISGKKADGSEYKLTIEKNEVSGEEKIIYQFTSADKNVLQLLTIYKPEYNLVFTHYDKDKSYTLASYNAFGFMVDSVPADLENPLKKVEEDNLHAFNAIGKIPADTVTAIKNCTTLEFILKDPNDVSPQISISFEGGILAALKRNL